MRLKSKWLLPGFLCLLIFSGAIYLHNTTVFKPVNIYPGKGRFADSANQERHLTLALYSPLGKKLNYTKQLLFTGNNKRHAFLGKIQVQISPYLYAIYQPILITAGADSCLIGKEAFLKTGECYTATATIRNNGFGAKVFSVGRWAPVENLLLSVKSAAQKILDTVVVSAIFVWGVLLLCSILLLLFVVLTLFVVVLQNTIYSSVLYKFGALLNKLLSYILKAANKGIVHLMGIFSSQPQYLWHINRLTIILVCILIQVSAYKYLAVFGFLYYTGWVSFCFYCLLFFITTELWSIFPRVNFFLSITVAIVVLALVDFGLYFFNINKQITELRSGYYVSQNRAFIKTWYYTKPPNVNHCLCNLEYQFYRTTNSEGLSDSEFTTAKRPNELRIMGIGDSFTEGDGTDKDSTYLKFTERILNRTYGNKNLKFMNAGICGSDIVFEYQLLHDKLLKYKPDIVIAVINSTDITDIALRGGFERFLANGTVRYRSAPWWEFFYVQNYVFRLIATVVLRADWQLITNAEMKKLGPLSIKVIQETSVKLNQLGKQNGFKFILLVHPFLSEWQTKKYNFGLDAALEQTGRVKNIDVYNALEYYVSQKHIPDKDITNYYWKIDGHHNAKGYGLLGEVAAYKIDEVIRRDSVLFTRR